MNALRGRFPSSRWPYILLAGLLGVVFIILLLRGLNLGYYGDGLYFEYMYTRLGVRGGMNWLVLHDWKRHLLAGLFTGGLHVLFPGKSAFLYISTFFFHFLNGFLIFLFCDTLLRRNVRWLSFSAALLFVTFPLPILDFFDTSVDGIVTLTFTIGLLSLYCFLRYVQGGRQNHWWREFSIVLYCLAVTTYSLTALLWLVHPVIAFIEDRRTMPSKARWMFQLVQDSIWYVVFLIVYTVVLGILFPDGAGAGLVTSPALFFRQVQLVVGKVFNVSDILNHLAEAFTPGTALVTVLLALGAGVAVWVLLRQGEPAAQANSSEKRQNILNLILIGVTILAISVLWASIINWARVAPFTSRAVYPAVMGVAIIAAGVLALILDFIPSRTARQIIMTGFVGLWCGVGSVYTWQIQGDYLNRAQNSQEILNAVHAAIPTWKAGTSPYMLLYTDQTYYPILIDSLNAKDVNLSSLFQLMYKNYKLGVDVIYYDAPEKNRPGKDIPGRTYIGPYLIAEVEGIYSPLKPVSPWPYTPADPEQMVIIYYNSASKTAQIMAELPQDVLQRSNIVEHVPVQWRTDYEVIGS